MKDKEILGDNSSYLISAIKKVESTKQLDIYLEMKADRIECAGCNKEVKYVREKYERTVRDLPIGEYITVKLHYPVKIFECSNCKKRRTEKLSLVENGQFATDRFKLYIGKLATMIAPSQVAEEFSLDDNTVYRYEDYFLKKNSH